MVALTALVLLFVLPAEEDRPTSVTITESRQDVHAGPSPGLTTTDTTVYQTPASDTSAFGQLLASQGAKLLLNVGLVGLAAFLAGAVVQRLWLGEFGITVGPLELPQLPEIGAEDAERAVTLASAAGPIRDVLIGLQGEWRGAQPIPQYFDIHDARLQFLSIRIELEQRLRQLARSAGIEGDLSLDRLLQRLQWKGLIEQETAAGLSQWLTLGDQAAAGADVPQQTVDVFKEKALAVLYALGELRRAQEEVRHPDRAEGDQTDPTP